MFTGAYRDYRLADWSIVSRRMSHQLLYKSICHQRHTSSLLYINNLYSFIKLRRYQSVVVREFYARLFYRNKMHPSRYSTCLYEYKDWAKPARHAQSLHDYVDIDFRYKRSGDGSGNGYVASRGIQVAAMLDIPQPTDALSIRAQSFDDVISGAYSEAAQSGAVIARRNERERNRVKTINQTFARLRQHLPSSAAASVTKHATHGGAGGAGSAVMKIKKLSKVQILRAAIHYIGQLQELLMTSDDDADSSSVISDADDSRKLHLQTQYISNSSSSSSSVSAGVENCRHEHTDYSSPTDVKRKTIHFHP